MRSSVLGVLFLLSACGQPEIEPAVPFEPDVRVDRNISFSLEAPYRLGDGLSVGSSCQAEISGEELSGTRFEFDFELTGGTSTLSVSLEGICGVDFATNVVAVLQSGKILSSAFLEEGAVVKALTPFRAEPGKYTIIVESGSLQNDQLDFDLDDFLIKKLNIASNQTLKKGEVRVQRDPNRTRQLRLSANRAVRLGDQGGDGLTCTSEVPVTNAKTIEYHFQVPASGAVVDIADPKMCSVSMNENDFFLLGPGGSVKLYTLVNSGFSGAFPSLTLAAGVYRIQVRSNPALQGTDFDDFLIRSMDLWSDVALTGLGIHVIE